MDLEEFRVRGREMVDYICDYLSKIESRRVTSNVEPGFLKKLLPSEAPQEPEAWEDIMEDVESKIMPGITHWQHPRFHAYFPSGNSFPSILADMLADAMSCNGFSWAASPSYTELEVIVLDWFGKAIGLPSDFISSENSTGGGVMQGSASECILVSMLAARAQAIKALKINNKDMEESDFLPRLVAYCSQESHSCVEKAAKILLVKIRILETDTDGSLRGSVLEEAMHEDEEKGLVPFFVSTTLGSTACCSFDNLEEIGPVCKKFPHVWLHVDGAYVGNAFICPELRVYMKGIEHADSFNTNPNKWLLVNFDCSTMWVKHKLRLTTAMVVDPLYLQHENANETIDLRHWGIPLSRRFRSLKLWFVIRKYGITGLQKYIRNHIKLAKLFESHVKSDNRFEVVNDVILGLVCFRLNGSDKLNQDLLASINHSGKLHMIPSIVKGKYVIRFCVVTENACEADIDYAWNTISSEATILIESIKKPTTPEAISRKLPRQLSRRFSFTRSVSHDLYKRSVSRSNLYDGATPILVPDENPLTFDGYELDENLKNCINEEDVFVNDTVKSSKNTSQMPSKVC